MATVTATATQAAPAPPGQPDIAYAPDYEKWQARAARRQATEDLPTDVPAGFPARLTGDLVWEGATVAEAYDWNYVLSPEQLDEVDGALRHFKSLDIPLGSISAANFPLPRLHGELRRLSDELHRGHGFFVLKGLRVDAYARADNVTIYAGISAHVAPLFGRQDHAFDGRPADVLLTHVKDLSRSRARADDIGSPAYTADGQVFHTDAGDVVSLFALETSAAGGASRLASTWRVYNEIARTRPDLIHTLSQPWDREVYEHGSPSWHPQELLYHYPATESSPERVLLQYARRYFVGFGARPRPAAIPAITEAQAEALDTLHFLGARFSLATDFQKGDIQYVNNLAVFHARDAFADTDEQQRHLLRFWLRDPENAWPTPERLQYRWDELYKDVTPEKAVFPLEPFIRSAGGKAKGDQGGSVA